MIVEGGTGGDFVHRQFVTIWGFRNLNGKTDSFLFLWAVRISWNAVTFIVGGNKVQCRTWGGLGS